MFHSLLEPEKSATPAIDHPPVRPTLAASLHHQYRTLGFELEMTALAFRAGLDYHGVLLR